MENQKYLEALNTVQEIAHIGLQETDLIMIKGSAQVAPLTGEDETVLKSANTKLSTFLKQFNKILYEKIVNKEEIPEFDSFENYLHNLTPQDKALLIFALSLSSFQKLGVVSGTCEKCETKFPVDILPEELWHEDSLQKIWDKEVSPFEYTEIQTFLNDSLQFEFGIPNEYTRIQIMELIEQNSAGNTEDDQIDFQLIDTISFFCRKIIIKKPGKKKDIVLTDTVTEIYPFLHELPTKVKDIIFETVDLTIFDEYMPKLYQEARCPKCGHINPIPVEIESLFFRRSLLTL